MKTRFRFLMLMGAMAALAGWVIADEPASSAGTVQVEIIEAVPPGTWAWSLDPQAPRERYEQAAMGFAALPHKYTPTAVIGDRTGPFLVRATAIVRLGQGSHTLLLRSLNGAKLSMDGKELAVTPFTRPDGDGHDSVAELPPAVAPGARLLPMGHSEKIIQVTGDDQAHTFLLEAYVGGKNLRPEIGELSVSRKENDGMFYLMSPRGDLRVPMTDEGWETYARHQAAETAALNARLRKIRGEEESRYWQWRHELARARVAQKPAPALPQVSAGMPVLNDVDRFIGRKLQEAGIGPAPLTDDHAFLRRVYLDVVGVIPTVREIEAFFADAPSVRRTKVIDRLLRDPRWADQWVGYWQDVLGENPGILKPEQNNTGPFRWWIHESFLDNKPFDRFATELAMMEGSVYYGGPAGFALATQNDVPMAEKAHVIAQAFAGVEMKCARCHDAPYHDVKQQDLFSLAAMLNRKPQAVPATSSIPTKALARKLMVTVSLKPGQEVSAAWPFGKLSQETSLPQGLVRHTEDPRERLAALMTWPTNERFAQVIVNRLWQRYLGFGLVEPADDWETAKPSHPQLLEYLSRELVVSGYDLKHIARLILNSHAYQRAVEPAKSRPVDSKNHLFASPMRRRLAAEQVADSLLLAAGMACDTEPLNFDPEARRPVDAFLNLGRPTRAWQFASLSNERDRPALAMPRAQSMTDVLSLFGWRESRPSPLTRRDDSPLVQQPAVISNGLLSRRVCRLSDDNGLTRLCLESNDLDRLVDGLFLHLLSRLPNNDERSVVVELLRDGFEGRVVPGAGPAPASTYRPRAVSWSNHLNAQATEVKKEIERYVQQGAAPTPRLQAEWRQRAEDVVWALLNSPEFVFIP